MLNPIEIEVDYEDNEPLMGLALWLFSDEEEDEDFEEEGVIYDEY